MGESPDPTNAAAACLRLPDGQTGRFLDRQVGSIRNGDAGNDISEASGVEGHKRRPDTKRPRTIRATYSTMPTTIYLELVYTWTFPSFQSST